MNAKDIIIIIITVPDAESALNISKMLVDKRLAACVNTIAGVTSCFRWECKLKAENELLLLIKTVKHNFAKVSKAVESIHPYDLPEIIAIPISDGLPAYLKWVADETAVDY